jgi:hypothetical protein
MRIKAVLRDSDILAMDSGSKERIITTAQKNIDRFINLTSLLKVMGLTFKERTKMLDTLVDTDIHIWLSLEGDQHIIYLTKGSIPEEPDFVAYQWQ